MRSIIQKFGLPFAIVVIVVALLLILFNRPNNPVNNKLSGDPSMAFFVDEATGEESVRSKDDIPPLPGKDGKPTVVMAIKYSIDGGEPQVLYYVKFTETLQAELNAVPSAGGGRHARVEMVSGLRQVRSPASGSQWVESRSEAGQAVTAFPAMEPGQRFTFIHPPVGKKR